jgi:hypothetical protein
MVNTDSNEYPLSLKALKLFPTLENLTALNSLKIKSGFTHAGVFTTPFLYNHQLSFLN